MGMNKEILERMDLIKQLMTSEEEFKHDGIEDIMHFDKTEKLTGSDGYGEGDLMGILFDIDYKITIIKMFIPPYGTQYHTPNIVLATNATFDFLNRSYLYEGVEFDNKLFESGLICKTQSDAKNILENRPTIERIKQFKADTFGYM